MHNTIKAHFNTHNICRKKLIKDDILQYLCSKCILLARPVELYYMKTSLNCDFQKVCHLCCHPSNTSLFFKKWLPIKAYNNSEIKCIYTYSKYMGKNMRTTSTHTYIVNTFRALFKEKINHFFCLPFFK